MHRFLAMFSTLAMVSGCATTGVSMAYTSPVQGHTEACQGVVSAVSTTGERRMDCDCQGGTCRARYTPGTDFYHASGYGSGQSPAIAAQAALANAVGNLKGFPLSASQTLLCEPKGGWYDCVVSVFWSAHQVPVSFPAALAARYHETVEFVFKGPVAAACNAEYGGRCEMGR